MRICCLTQVEFSLDGFMRTDSLRVSPSSSEDGSSFTIKSSRLIGVLTFLDFFESGLTCVDLSFSLHAMMLKIYLLICSKTYVAVWVRNCMQLCVGCTVFVHIFVRICAM